MDHVRLELTCPGCQERFFVDPSQQGKIANCTFRDGWVDVPDLRGEGGTLAFADEQSRQWEETARQLVENARQIQQSQRALDHRERQDARFDELLERMAIVIEKWESLADRAGRLIDRLGNENTF